MTTQQIDEDAIRAAMGDMQQWALQCHAASLHLVKSGVLGKSRVARGTARGVAGQHSWAVLGDPYDKETIIVDVTLWSYDLKQPQVWIGTGNNDIHTPHGSGSIFEYGKPSSHGEKPIVLEPPEGGWSPAAALFLDMLGPLDQRGWMELAHAPVGGGWPAKEIITAMCKHRQIAPLIPIDIIGMITDENPDELYW